jgi:hypothetical protein
LSFFCLFFGFFFLQYWSSNSRPTPGATPPALLCEGFFQDRVSQNYLPGLTSNSNPPDLCLLSS